MQIFKLVLSLPKLGPEENMSDENASDLEAFDTLND
jgi:hypothetical protein